jgi:ATP-binding cassette subfamily F protein uup
MAALIQCQSIAKNYNLRPVFQNLDLHIHDSEKLGIFGPNGAGKSTLLKILANLESVDRGQITRRKGLRVSYAPQAAQFESSLTITESVERWFSGKSIDGSQQNFLRIESLLGSAGFSDWAKTVGSLSGGWQKRLLLCLSLAESADLVLLDEPTNHLDMQGIEWLEDTLSRLKSTLVMVTHDRYFLEQICRQSLEISSIYPNGTFRIDGGYGEFMVQKAQFLESQQSQLSSASNRLRTETAWLRKGAPARTTKQQARSKSAVQLAEMVAAQKSRLQELKSSFTMNASDRKTKVLVELKDVKFSYNSDSEICLFRDVNLILSPKMRLGLVGQNGSGKTTLLRTILGQLKPTSGSVKQADQLNVVYFDQHREHLPNGISVARFLAPDNDRVLYQGRSLHVSSYAKMFAFAYEKLETATDRLSGGEKARLLIAKMLLQPADVLILDEPTNDLDIDTLEVLEESLLGFAGALILVTHDRYLMDRVSTGILGLLAPGEHEFFADYSQYALAETSLAANLKMKEKYPEKYSDTLRSENSSFGQTTAPLEKRTKLSYKDQRELEGMEDAILKVETQIGELQTSLNAPSLQTSSIQLQELCQKLELAERQREKLYTRWDELTKA